MPATKCPKCAAEMEPGFVLDKSYSEQYFSEPEWAEGVPEHSLWTGLKLRGRERLPVTTYKCTGCGFLESYARSRK